MNFLREAGATFEEKAKNACSRCDKCKGKFPVNPDRAADEPIDKAETQVNRFFAARREHERFGLEKWQLTNLDYNGILLIDEIVEPYKEAAEKEKLQLLREQNGQLAAMLGIKK